MFLQGFTTQITVIYVGNLTNKTNNVTLLQYATY